MALRQPDAVSVTDWDHNDWYPPPAAASAAGLTGRRLFGHQRTHDVMPIADSELTTRDVRATAGDLLTDARVRRLLLWRYLLTWRKPGG